MTKLSKKSKVTSDPGLLNMASELCQDYESLKTSATAQLTEAEKQVRKHEEYVGLYKQCLDLSTSTKQRLHSILGGSHSMRSPQTMLADVQV